MFRRPRRRVILPARVVVYFVLALALFAHASYLRYGARPEQGLRGSALASPAASSLASARRRVGGALLRRLLEVMPGPVATPGQREFFWRGPRVVAVDGTTLSVPDEQAMTWRYPKHRGPVEEFGYPLLRLVTRVECGSRA